MATVETPDAIPMVVSGATGNVDDRLIPRRSDDKPRIVEHAIRAYCSLFFAPTSAIGIDRLRPGDAPWPEEGRLDA